MKARMDDTTNNNNQNGSTMSVATSDVETSVSNDNTDKHNGSNSVDATQKVSSQNNNGTNRTNILGLWFRTLFSRYPLPVLSLQVDGLCFDIDKAFIAPINPDIASTSTSNLAGTEKTNDDDSNKIPAALPPSSIRNHRNNDTTLSQNNILPSFDQQSVIDAAMTNHIKAADKMSFYIQTWTSRVRKKILDPNQKMPISKRRLFANLSNKRLELEDEEEYNNHQKNELVIKWCRRIFKYVQVILEDSVILISGVPTNTVLSARKKLHPHFASMFLAKVPISCRTFAVILIKKLSLRQTHKMQHPELTLSGFSIHIASRIQKNPSSQSKRKRKTPQLGNLAKKIDSHILMNESQCFSKKFPQHELQKFEWHGIAQLDLSVDLIGSEKIAVWLISYDHQWDVQHIGSNIEVLKLELTLLSKPLHQLMVILDDYFDPNSPVNEWKAWMIQRMKMNQPKVSTKNLRAYRLSYLSKTKYNEKRNLASIDSKNHQSDSNLSNNKYDQINKKSQKKESASTDKSTPNTEKVINSIEERLPFGSIMRQRSIVMIDEWKFSQNNAEFLNFLHRTGSSIFKSRARFENDDGSDFATPAQSLYGRIYQSDMDALISFLTMKFSFLAPHVKGEIRIRKIHVTFVQDSLDVSDISEAKTESSDESCNVNLFCPVTVEFDDISLNFRKNSISSREIIARSSTPKALNFNSDGRISREIYRLGLRIGSIILSPTLFENNCQNVEKNQIHSNDSLGILYKVSEKLFLLSVII